MGIGGVILIWILMGQGLVDKDILVWFIPGWFFTMSIAAFKDKMRYGVNYGKVAVLATGRGASYGPIFYFVFGLAFLFASLKVTHKL